MTIIGLLIFIIIVGVLLWLVNLIPMPAPIKALLNIVVFVVLVIYVLQFFGIIGPILPMPTFPLHIGRG